MMEQDQKSWLARIAVVSSGILILAVALPIVFFALQAALGIAAIGIIAVLGFAVVKTLPMLGQKWENRLLGMRKAEARANPIEQMQNRLLQKQRQLDAFRNALTEIGGQITGMERMIVDRAKADPEQDLSMQRGAVTKMKAFYEQMKLKFNAACSALLDLTKEVERKKFEFGFAQAGQSALRAMSVSDADNMLKDMLADEAFKAVEQRFDSTFAALDIESTTLTNHSQLEFGKDVVLDVSAIKIPLMAEAK